MTSTVVGTGDTECHEGGSRSSKVLLTPAPVREIFDGTVDAPVRREVLFVDVRIPAWQDLVAAVRPGIDVVQVDSSTDGWAQMAAYASTHQGISAIHILGHGGVADVQLGNARLTESTMSSYAADLATIASSLNAGADVLLYGCTIAGSDAGIRFIADLSQRLRADVAASEDVTGGVTVGGDWVLEKTTGSIETALFADRATLDAYHHQLAYTGVVTFESVANGDTSGNVTVGAYTFVATTTASDGMVVTDGGSGDSAAGSRQFVFAPGTSNGTHEFHFSNNETFSISTIWVQNQASNISTTTFSFQAYQGATPVGAPVSTGAMADQAYKTLTLNFTGITKVVITKTAGSGSSTILIDSLAISDLGPAADTTPPTIQSVSIPNTTMKIGDVVTATITVSSDADPGYTLGTSTINGYALSGLTKVNNTTYTATFTVASGGTDVSAGSNIPVSIILKDGANNPSSAYTTSIFQASDKIDANAPFISAVSVPNTTFKVGDVVTATITVAPDSDTGYTLGAALIGGFPLTNLTKVNSTTYTATFTVASGGTDVAAGSSIPVSISLTDSAGNASTLYTTAIVQGADRIDANAPLITSVSIPNTPMKIGDVVTATITVTSDADTGYTLGAASIGGFPLTSLTRINSTTYTASFTVTNGGTDIAAGSNVPLSVVLIDSAGNSSLAYTSAIVQGADRIDAHAPAISGTMSKPADNAYKAGSNLDFTVTYDDTVSVNGTDSTLALDIGGVTRQAALYSKSANSVTYRYTIQAGDNDSNGISIGAVTLNTTSITDAAGNAANNSLSGHLPSTLGVLVDTTAPAVSGNLAVANATYKLGDNLDFVVTFDENVSVTGTDSTLGLTVGSTSRNATYLSKTASSVTYRYTIQTGDLDTDGIAVGAISLGTSTITDAAANPANISLAGHTPVTTAVRVDGIAPAVTGNISKPADGLRILGNTMDFTVTFDDNVTVTGTDSTLGLVIGAIPRQAALVAGATTANSVTYRYTVQSGDDDANGIAVGGITLNTSTIRDAAGNNANTSLVGHLPSTTGLLVDTSAPGVLGNVGKTDGSYKADSAMQFTVFFTEDVTISGTDSRLSMDVGGVTRFATYASKTANSITYSYTVEAGETDTDGITIGSITLNTTTIRDIANNDANVGLAGHLPVTAGVIVDTTDPIVTSVTVPANGTYASGQTLSFTVNFSEAVTVTGTPRLALDIGGVTKYATYNSGSGTSALVFKYTLESGLSDSDGISVAALGLNSGTIKDAATNDAFLSLNSIGPTGLVKVDATGPAVMSVSVPANATYVAGQTLSFTAHFNEAVAVTGTPRLALDIGGVTKYASYASGSGSPALVFTYTVEGGLNDSDGISVGALELNAGTLKDAFTNDADLTLFSVGSTALVKVDSLAPTVAGNITKPADGSYKAGSPMQFTVSFTEGVTITGTDSTLALDVGGVARTATYASKTASSITYSYTVQAGDTDTSGISIGSITLNGTTIRDSANNDANVGLGGHLPVTTGVIVDTTAPSIASVSVPTNATYVAGQTLSFTANFSEAVTVTGTPRLALDIGGVTKYASYTSGSGSPALVFTYTVESGLTDSDGISVGSLELNAGTLKDAAANDAALTLNSVGATGLVKVDSTGPAIASVAVPANATYVAGQTLSFTANFSEAVTVTGTPRLALDIGGVTKYASYASGSGSPALVFTYTVEGGLTDSDGISVAALELNGGTLKDAAANDAALTLNGVGSTALVKVDSVPPTVAGNITKPADGSYKAGAQLDFTVSFSEGVSVSGTASTLALNVGGNARSATYASKTATSITYSYTVQAGDTDADGIAIGGITLNGTTIRDSANNDANVSLAGHLPVTAGVIVDTTAPAIASVSVPANATYVAGQTLSFTANFSEAVTVTGTPRLAIDIGGVTKYASYASGSPALVFTYTVEGGLTDSDGISVGALELNGGTLKDAAANNAALTLNGVGSAALVKVDSVAPTVAGNITKPADGSYKAGAQLDFTVSFSEGVTVSGTDSTLALNVGGVTRTATYASKTASSITYSYTVQAGDTDADGIAIGSITLNGTTIRDSANNDANVSLAGHLPATAGVIVDTTAPAIASVSVPANATYVAGQTLSFTANFSEIVTVTGTPRLALDIGGVTKYANYASGSGSPALVFTYTVEGGLTDSDGISVGSLELNGGTLKDVAANGAALTLNGVGSTALVKVDSVAPTVAGNIIKPADGSYKAGSPMQFTVSFTEGVTITGTDSTLALDVGGNARTATYASKTASSITYSYTVQAGDTDADGISIGSITLNGTTIRDSANNDANVALAGHLPASAGVIVDTTAPAIASVSVPANATYVAGQTLSFTANFSEAVTVTGTPRLALDIGGVTKYASYASGSGSPALVFTYTVEGGLNDSDGISVAAPELNGGTLKDAAANDATLTLNGVGSTALVKVDSLAPTVAGNITKPADGSYKAGSPMQFTVSFTEGVTITGTDSTLALDVGGVARTATYASKTASSITYSYTVQAGDTDTDGIAIGSITLNGTTIRDSANNDANVSLASHLPVTAGVIVDTTAPAIASVSVPANATYVTGQTLSFTANFSEAVTVTGTPRLALDIGGVTKYASYASGSGSPALVFTYTVEGGLTDRDGISVGSLELNGGTLKDVAANNAALTLNGVGSTALVKVDSVAPTVAGNITKPADGSYKAGAQLDFTVSFSEGVTVSGTDSTLALNVGGNARSATYASKTASSITYSYTVQAGDTDTDGISIGSITLNGTTIRDTGNNDANVALAGHLPVTAGVIVDTTAPAIASVSVPANATYVAGQTLSFTANFSEAVTVTGTPRLALDIGGVIKYASYASGSGSPALVFTYTVEGSLTDRDGITVGSLELNGGALKDAAANGAVLTLGSVGSTALVKVDSTAPSLNASGSTPADNATGAPTSSDVVLKFSEPLHARSDTTKVYLMALGDARPVPATMSINGSGELVIHPTSSLAYGTAYYVRWDANALVDAAGNAVSAVSNTTTFNFTTEEAPEAPPKDDGDNIPAAVEKAVPALPLPHGGTPVAGDGNGDGISDSQQANVTSVPFLKTETAQSNPGSAPPVYLTLVANSVDGKADTTKTDVVLLKDVKQLDAPANKPADLSMPLGQISFLADVKTGGATESFSIYVDGNIPINGYWKQTISGTWVNLASPEYGGKVVTEGGKTRLDFKIVDGGQFDSDGKADGVITDPGGPGYRITGGSTFTDTDKDQFPDQLEAANGLKVGIKDNDIFGSNKLFVMELYRDILFREADVDGLAYWQARLDSGALTKPQVTEAFLDSAEFEHGAGAITRLYLGALHRLPDDAGMDAWVSQLQGGASLTELASRFAASPEFQAKYATPDNGAFVQLLYQNILGRSADVASERYWTGQLASGVSRDAVLLGLTESAEYQAATDTMVSVVLDYVGLLGRTPEQAGFDYWVAALQQGMPEITVIGSFMATAEFHDRFLA